MDWMILPILACTVVVFTLGWFGLHVLERGVIFVDLALAQVAALGTTWAVFLGHEPDGHTAFAISLAFTFVGAIAFSAARLFEERVPQEAIIGIAYAVSAALGILLVHFADDPHGGEKIEHLLVGNLVWIQPGELLVLAVVCGVVGVAHAFLSRPTLPITFDPAGARAAGANVAAWDLFFYLSFGLALTAIVAVSGVLLVFSYLVIPAVVARLFWTGVRARLLAAWALGLGVSVAGVGVSYEHPVGPVIVSLFGVVLVAALAVYAARAHAAGGRGPLGVLGGVALVGGLLFASSRLSAGADADHEHDHEHAEEATVVVPAPGGADPYTRLQAAVGGVRAGNLGALVQLAELCTADEPFIRVEADSRLRTLAGEAAPTYDAVAGPDIEGRWVAWARAQQAMPASAAALLDP